MIIMVAKDGMVSLQEPGNFRGFHLASAIPASRGADLAAAAGKAGIRIEGDHAWIPCQWVTAEAGGDATWTASFDKMVAYAREKGWMDAAGISIRAHIEWPGDA